MILLIDNYDSFTYNLFQSLSFTSEVVKVVRNDQFSLKDIEALQPDGIVISPGPGRPENAGYCIELIQKTDLPILGVCLGHQAIGYAFGGDIVQAPEILHGKSRQVAHDGSMLYENISQGFSAGRYHSLVIDPKTLPDCFEISSKTEDNIIMGIQHKERPLFGVQFHPESILTEEGDVLIKNFVNYAKKYRGAKC